MPRKQELTWQPGDKGRRGRWRRKYKGLVYYFPFGTSKSDVAGYREAVVAWKRKKIEIDEAERAQPKPYGTEYQAAIDEWSLALQFCVEHGDPHFAHIARQKIEDLKARLNSHIPPALKFHDRLLNRWDLEPEVMSGLGELVEIWSRKDLGIEDAVTTAGASDVSLVTRGHASELDGSPQRIRREVWRDRLERQRSKSSRAGETVEDCVESFLAHKRAQVKAGKISAGRFDPLRGHLHHFRDWVGGSFRIEAVTGKVLGDYHDELMAAIGKKVWSSDYSKDRLNAVKGLIRWLWCSEMIADLPRVLLDKNALTISKVLTEPEMFSLDEVKALLTAADARTRLYLLLMLNTGMTQKDVSDLKPSEVDWSKGIITRKRSKTRKHKTPPTVSFQLWRPTFELLQSHRSASSDRVLVNANGSPLKIEELNPDDKLRKVDNIASAFNRLRRKTGIVKPLKVFRKTSASNIRASREFHGFEHEFLANSLRGITDRHYARFPQDRFDEAVAWLGIFYEVDQLPAATETKRLGAGAIRKGMIGDPAAPRN